MWGPREVNLLHIPSSWWIHANVWGFRATEIPLSFLSYHTIFACRGAGHRFSVQIDLMLSGVAARPPVEKRGLIANNETQVQKGPKSAKKLLPLAGPTINIITLIHRLMATTVVGTLGKVHGMILAGRVNSAAV